MIIDIRKRYEERTRKGMNFDPDEGRTEQAHKKESDINFIVRKHTEVVVYRDYMSKLDNLRFGEVDGGTFHEMQNIIAAGQSAFDELPSALRTQFENDPAKFLDFVHNPDNEEALIEMGLAYERDPVGDGEPVADPESQPQPPPPAEETPAE